MRELFRRHDDQVVVDFRLTAVVDHLEMLVDGEEMGLVTVPTPGAALGADRHSVPGMPRLDKEPRVAVCCGREERDAAVIRSARSPPTRQSAGDRPLHACRADDEERTRLEILNGD